MRYKRTTILWLLVIALCLFGFSSDGRAETEIIVGRLLNSKMSAIVRQLADRYHATHPDVRIRILPESDTHRDQYLTLERYLERYKDVPDIVGIVYQVEKKLEELPYLVNQGYLIPVDEWPGWDEYDHADFFESLWPPIEYKGKYWGVPAYSEHGGMGYSFAAFERAGIEKLPVTWDDFVKVWRQTTCDLDGDGNVDQWGLALPDGVAFDLWSICVQRMGGQFYSNDRFDLSDEKLRTAFRRLKRLKDEGLLCQMGEFLSPESAGGGTRFAATQYVQSWQFSHYKPYIPPGYVKPITQTVGVLPFPAFEVDVTPVIGCGYLGIRRNPSSKVKACFDFIKLIADEATQMNLVERYDFLPLRRSTYESEQFREKVESKPWLKVFTDNLRRCRPTVQRPGATKAHMVLRRHFTLAYTGRKGVEEAFAEAERKMNEILKSSDDRSLTSISD